MTLVALTTIWTVALINCASVTAGGRTALALTIAKVALISVRRHQRIHIRPWRLVAFQRLGIGRAAAKEWPPARAADTPASAPPCSGRCGPTTAGTTSRRLSGEIRNPQRNLPRAFVGGMLVVASLYLFVNVAYYYAMTPLEIASVPTTSSVATEVLKRFLGPIAVSMTAVALMVSSFGSLHASVLANSRVPYAMARDGSVLSRPCASLAAFQRSRHGPLLRKPHGAACSHCQARMMRSPTR